MRQRLILTAAGLLVVGTVVGCGDGDSSSPTAPTSVETSTSSQTDTASTGNTGMTVNGISLSELPAAQTMTVMPVDPSAVTYMSPFRPSHTGINIYTVSGGRFLSPGTGIVTNIELNTGNGLPGGSNYGIRIHLTSTGLYAWYHFEVNG